MKGLTGTAHTEVTFKVLDVVTDNKSGAVLIQVEDSKPEWLKVDDSFTIYQTTHFRTGDVVGQETGTEGRGDSK